MNIKQFLTLLGVAILLSYSSVCSQSRRIAITIDDVPFQGKENIPIQAAYKTNLTLLRGIHEEQTPVTAFFTLKQVHSGDQLGLLYRWRDDSLITLGNHTENHLDHSKTDYKTFVKEVNSVDQVLRTEQKPLRYFRFPYNALGKDSIDQAMKKQYLDSIGYTVTPFTIETSDYIFNDIYEHELSLGHPHAADSIISKYLTFTETLLDTMEVMCNELYGRQPSHIFLCHDVPINAACYHQIMKIFRNRGYQFITLEEALKDPLYSNTNYYHGRYGFSWIYRWIADTSKRKQYQKREPEPDAVIYDSYKTLQEKKK